jgi:hypothetical protein
MKHSHGLAGTMGRAIIMGAIILVLTMQGCAKRTPVVTVLTKPSFTPQSQPDSTVETGIGQDPSTGGIFLQWYSVTSATGYKVFRSDTSDVSGNPMLFSMIRDLSIGFASNDTSVVDQSVENGVCYYYYITAYASDGSVSSPSDTINYTLMNRAGLKYPVLNVTCSLSSVYFNWHDNAGGGFTVIRLDDISQIPISTIWISSRFQVFGTLPAENFNFDSTAEMPLFSGHSYQWRIDRFNVDTKGRPYEGSRSAWGIFNIK